MFIEVLFTTENQRIDVSAMKLIVEMMKLMKWSIAVINYFQVLILKCILYLKGVRGTESIKTKHV